MIKINKPSKNYSDIVGKNPVYPGGMGSSKLIADPFISGWAYVLFTRVPEQIAKLTSPSQDLSVDYSFFRLMELVFKEVSGLNDIDLDTTGVTGGFTGNEHHYPTSINKNCNEITMKYQALSGKVISGPFENWVNSIMDMETGVSTLDEFGIKNYSCEFLYFTTNPGIGSSLAETRKNAIEEAVYFTNCFPKRNFKGHQNYSSNSHDASELDQPFAVNPHFSSQITEWARNVAASTGFYENFIQKQQKVIPDNIGKSFNALPDWLKESDIGVTRDANSGDLLVKELFENT